MINPIEPGLKGMCLLSITDSKGSHFTVNRTGKLAAGLVMSDPTGAAVAIRLSRQERAALIATLIELQEEEDLP